MAGRAAGLRALADGLRAVPPLAAGWDLAGDPDGLAGRADAAGLITWHVSVDSTVARAHQHAAGARGGRSAEGAARRRAAEPADHGLGRSRGGLTTKVHLACEQGQKPLSLVITAGQRGDARSSTPS